MNKNHRRGFGMAVAAVSVLAACSVDTDDVHFVDDDVFTQLATDGGDPGSSIGGVANMGGVLNKAGGTGQAGSANKSGTSNGGASPTAGSPSAGSNSGGMPMGGSGNPGQCQRVVGNSRDLLIDDLDDGDSGLPMLGGREGGWYVSNDGTPGGTQVPAADPSRPPLPSMGGADATALAMRMAGTGFTLWGANMGLVLLSPPGHRVPCPYDVTPHRGVRFFIKGVVTDRSVRFAVPTVQTHALAQGGTCVGAGVCGDHFGFDIALTSTWTETAVDFSLLTQRGFGKPAAFDETQVLNIEFEVQADVQFDIWVDQLQFY